jgi:hypothetical protein
MEFGGEFLKLYGPLGLGWVAAAALAFYIARISKEHRAEMKELRDELLGVVKGNQEVIERNTEQSTKLVVLLNERLPKSGG